MVSKNLSVGLFYYIPSSTQNKRPFQKKYVHWAARAVFVSPFAPFAPFILVWSQLLPARLCRCTSQGQSNKCYSLPAQRNGVGKDPNTYPDSPHSQGGMKFTTQISPLLMAVSWAHSYTIILCLIPRFWLFSFF